MLAEQLALFSRAARQVDRPMIKLALTRGLAVPGWVMAAPVSDSSSLGS